MSIDIFQYSNMYTLRNSIQWLADEAHVKEECGPYVIKEGMVCDICCPGTWLTPYMTHWQGGQSQIGRSSFTCTHG